MNDLKDIEVSLDTVKFAAKPDKWEVANISKRIGKGIKRLNTRNIKTFAENVGQYGMSFATGDVQERYTQGGVFRANAVACFGF